MKTSKSDNKPRLLSNDDNQRIILYANFYNLETVFKHSRLWYAHIFQIKYLIISHTTLCRI